MLTRENAGEAAGWNTSDAIRRYVDDLTRLLAALDTEAIVKFADILFSAYQEGRTVFFAGNGGSAATASHFACDMAKTVTGYSKGKRLRAVSLADSVPLLTAWGNDSAYDDVFAEQLRNLARPGDCLVAISCSGKSKNVVRAVELARAMGLTTVGLLGFDGGTLKPMVDLPIVIESDNYQRVEDVHSIIMHIVTDRLIEAVNREGAAT
jgi:Phosphoheptose isomerase